MRGLKASLLLAGTGAAALYDRDDGRPAATRDQFRVHRGSGDHRPDRLSDYVRALPSAGPPRQHGRPAFGRNQFLQRVARAFHDRPLQQDHHLDARRQSGIAPGTGGHQHRRVHPASERCDAWNAGLRRDHVGSDRPGRNRRCAARAASRCSRACCSSRARAHSRGAQPRRQHPELRPRHRRDAEESRPPAIG